MEPSRVPFCYLESAATSRGAALLPGQPARAESSLAELRERLAIEGPQPTRRVVPHRRIVPRHTVRTNADGESQWHYHPAAGQCHPRRGPVPSTPRARVEAATRSQRTSPGKAEPPDGGNGWQLSPGDDVGAPAQMDAPRSPSGKRHPLLPAVMSKNAASFAYRNGFKKPSGRPPALSSASLISET